VGSGVVGDLWKGGSGRGREWKLEWLGISGMAGVAEGVSGDWSV
jgi:hypothetical protein